MRDEEHGSLPGTNESPRRERPDLLDIRERTTAHRSITAPVTCPGWYPVKVPFCSPETSRYLVGMWVNTGAIGNGTKMFGGGGKEKDLTQPSSGSENLNTKQR